MKCFVVFALLFVCALAAPSESGAEEHTHEMVENSQVSAMEDANAREKKSAYYKQDDYKQDYYKPEPVKAVFYKPPGPCAVPLLVSCKSNVDYGKLEYKPSYKDYSPEYKPEYKSY